MAHRHVRRFSGMFGVPHIYCSLCGRVSFTARWPFWKGRG